MKLSNKIGGVAQKISSTVIFAGIAIYLLYLYYIMKYIPFFLAAMVILLPVAVNFFLQLFSCRFSSQRPQKTEPTSETKKIKRFFMSVGYAFKRVAYALTSLYNRIQKILQIVFVVLAFAGIQILFVLMMPKFTSTPLYESLNYSQPIIFAILFVVVIVIDKWIKHSEATNEKTGAFFRNMRIVAYLTNLVLVLSIVSTVIKLLGFYDLQKYLYYAVIGIFYYSSAFILVSLAILFLKKEMEKSPKLIVLLPFSGKGENDLSVIAFLENNTGITMRGLWSMRFVKRLIPYTVISIAALFWLSTGIVQVEANQEAVVYRLGVLQEETLGPGIHFTLPAPFDKVEYYNTDTVNRMTIGYDSKVNSDNLWTQTHGTNEHMLLLGDGNELVSLNLRIEYRIDDLYRYVSMSNSPDSMISAYAYNLIMQRVIRTDLKTLLAVDRNAFALNLKQDLIATLDKNDVGVEIVNVYMESIHPPLAVAEDGLSIAEKYQEVISQEIAAEESVRKATTAAAVTKADAEAQKTAAINKATAEKYKAIAEATSSVSEFMASVAANDYNSDAYHYYKYLDAITKAYGNNKLVLVGDGVDTSKLYFGNFIGGNSGGANTGNTQTGTDTYVDELN